MPSGSGHMSKVRTVIIIHTCTWPCETDSKRWGGECSAECIDASII